jgi:hypothetical protein
VSRGKGTVVTVLWIIVACLLAVVWVLSIIDIFRRHYSAWTTVGWIALIIVLPFVGTLIYWSVRKPTGAETEQEYLAQADLRRSAATRRIDPNG